MLRIISRLDVKNETVVKGIHFEGLRVVGNPIKMATKYYQEGADEIIYVDAVASLYGRNSILDIVNKSAEKLFVPLTVGGGLRNLEDIARVLAIGADKVAINTAAIQRPEFLREAAQHFGSQCIVLSVQAKKRSKHTWEALTESGREPTGKNVLEWIQKAETLGIGEVLLTSVDQDGTKLGFDIPLIEACSTICNVPLMVGGGAGNTKDIIEISKIKGVDAVVLASSLHYDLLTLAKIKQVLFKAGISIRPNPLNTKLSE